MYRFSSGTRVHLGHCIIFCYALGSPPGTVKPRPEAHMDMILFEVFLKSIDLIPQQILQQHYLNYR